MSFLTSLFKGLNLGANFINKSIQPYNNDNNSLGFKKLDLNSYAKQCFGISDMSNIPSYVISAYAAYCQSFENPTTTTTLKADVVASTGITPGATPSMTPSQKKGGNIHIKKENKGKFTDYCGGKVTNECITRAKKSGNKKLVKRAVFAQNARKWKK